MTKFLSQLFILSSMSLVLLCFPVLARAEQWYDRLPKNGNYVPPIESNTTQTPRDFDSVNAPESEESGDPAKTRDENVQSINADDTSLDQKPVGRTLMWWVGSIAGLVIVLLVTAPLWLKKVFRKMNP